MLPVPYHYIQEINKLIFNNVGFKIMEKVPKIHIACFIKIQDESQASWKIIPN